MPGWCPMRGDTDQACIAVRGCAIAVEVDQGLVFVGLPWFGERNSWHLFTAAELREVAAAMEQLQAAVNEGAP